MSANVVSIDRKPIANSDNKEEYVQAIQSWIKDRDDALSRQEIGAMDWRSRLDAQRKAIILGLAHYYQKHPRSDVAPGVAVVMTLLSDNENGAATISQQTLAKLFCRSRASIAEAQSRLRDDNIIITSRGRYAATYPVIPRAVTSGYNHMTWLIEAACAPEASVNCPASLDDCQLSGRTRQLNHMPGQTLQLEAPNCQVEDDSIVRPDLHNFKEINSKEEATSLRSVAHAEEGVPDAKDLVWGKCLDWLSDATKKPKDKLRPVIGRWLKVLTHEELVRTMRAAFNARTGDPISYVGAIVAGAKRAHHNVRRENGRILVFNGFEAELKTLLEGRDLATSLTLIEGRIPIGLSGIELETRVRSDLVALVVNSKEQDRRYAAAAEAKAQRSGRYPANDDSLYDGVL
jgi:hypothetical protein